jgi:hypothetical protein
MKDEMLRKRMAERENMQREKELVMRNKKELEEEKLAQMKKKEMERAYHKKTIEENEENKRKQLEQENFLREQEKKDLLEYTKMLDRQEADRLDDVKGREKKTQNLMNRMADTVLKDIDRKRELEEKKMQKYLQEKEMREKLDDEERLKRIQDNKKEMKQYLDRQTNDKREKMEVDKQLNHKQADVWRTDKRNFEEEEKAIKQKIFETNKEHAEFLKRQMEESKKGKRTVMSREEFLMNRRLINEIEGKPESPVKEEEN